MTNREGVLQLVRNGGILDGPTNIRERLLATGVDPEMLTAEDIEEAIFFGLKRAFRQKEGQAQASAPWSTYPSFEMKDGERYSVPAIISKLPCGCKREDVPEVVVEWSKTERAHVPEGHGYGKGNPIRRWKCPRCATQLGYNSSGENWGMFDSLGLLGHF